MYLKALLVTLIVTSTAAFAFEGNEGGGGGKGVVYLKADGSIDHVELLDLWEAENVWNRRVSRTNEPIGQQLEQALDRLKSATHWRDDITLGGGRNLKGEEAFVWNMKSLSSIFMNGRISGAGIQWVRDKNLAPTPDSFERVTPRSQKIAQIVRYEDDLNVIRIDLDLFEKMSMTDQAALILHEAFYKYLRDQQTGAHETNSLRVRKAVGLVFSGYPFTSVESQLKKGDYLRCGDFGSNTTVFLRYSLEKGCYKADATYIDHQPVLGLDVQALESSSQCPLKYRDRAAGPSPEYITIEDILKEGKERRNAEMNKVTVTPTMAGKIAEFFGVADFKPKVTNQEPSNRIAIDGATFMIEQPTVPAYSAQGTVKKPYLIQLHTGYSAGDSLGTGVTAELLDFEYHKIADLECYRP